MGTINLDERRKAVEPMSVKANGRTYKLAAYMPGAVMSSMLALANAEQDPVAATPAMRDAYRSLFGDDKAEAAMRDIGLDELQSIVQEAYKVGPGERKASPRSSPNGGTRSRRTSNGSTRST
jgi:hypothetical protein